MKRAVIFDFGGVLMKTADYSPRHKWDELLSLPHGSVENIVHGSEAWHKAQTGKISPESYWQDVGAQLGLNPEQTQQLAHDFYSGDRLDEELIAYIRRLSAEGVRVALLSNDSPELLPRLERLGIVDIFDPLVISALIGVMKPAPQAFQTILAQLNRPADETIFVDDMPANIQAAASLGIHAVHYTPGLHLPDRVNALLEI